MTARDAIFKTCVKCGGMFNVSAKERGGKRYICSECQGQYWFVTRDYLSEQTKRAREAQRNWDRPREREGRTDNHAQIQS